MPQFRAAPPLLSLAGAGLQGGVLRRRSSGFAGAAEMRGGAGAAGRPEREIGLTSREHVIPKRLSPKLRAVAEQEAPASRCAQGVNSARGWAQSPIVWLGPTPRCTREVNGERGRAVSLKAAEAGAA
eukprot:1561776-Pyramimonas_sp.AAC.1